MGSDWRSLPGSLTVPGFDLRERSRNFAAELSSLLNNTICHGVSLNSVISEGYQTRAVVGNRITRDNFDVTGIPITCNQRAPSLYLGLSMRLAPDEARTYLMVVSSVMILSTSVDVSDDSGILLHLDYERDKEDGYPEAHLQIHASSPAWESLVRQDGVQRTLDKLHLPVGGRRFRPTLEDLIEFLVTEKLVDKHPQCDAVLRTSRDEFHAKQLRAAVRRNPQPAIDQLTSLGYSVIPPAE